jgi:hypothetical protein
MHIYTQFISVSLIVCIFHGKKLIFYTFSCNMMPKIKKRQPAFQRHHFTVFLTDFNSNLLFQAYCLTILLFEIGAYHSTLIKSREY